MPERFRVRGVGGNAEARVLTFVRTLGGISKRKTAARALCRTAVDVHPVRLATGQPASTFRMKVSISLLMPPVSSLAALAARVIRSAVVTVRSLA